MAYSDDILSLSPANYWKFDVDSADSAGSSVPTNASVAFSGQPLSEDASSSIRFSSVSSRVSFADSTIIQSMGKKVLAGWFMTDNIQLPPKMIYSEGATDNVFHLVMAYGNNLMFEMGDLNNSVLAQVFGPVMQPNRAYHICAVYEGTAGANEVILYVDGVKQTLSQDAVPNSASATGRGQSAAFGLPNATNSIGRSSIICNCPVNMFLQNWAHWSNTTLSDTDVREILFEKGALPEITIESDTEANMQASVDSLSGTTRQDAPLCIRVEPVLGGGDFSLTFDNIKFNKLASIHVQYTGTDTLSIFNINGSDTSISSTPNGGTLNIIESVDVSLTILDAVDGSRVDSARVFLKSGAGGSLPENQTIINQLCDSNGELTFSFNYISDQPISGVVRKVGSENYSQGFVSSTITSNGLSQTVLLIPD
jgi:hypothetical protein